MVTDASDPHGVAVLDELANEGHRATRFNLSDLRDGSLIFALDTLELELGPALWVSDSTVVWWRRLGSVDTDELDDAESQLVQDEAPHILRGVLAGSGVRWVDDPFTVARAETKLLQLKVASHIGVRTPPTLVTSSWPHAEQFRKAHTSILAKALSPGAGIAPFVDESTEEDLDFVKTCPVLLQARVPARADLRVVTVGRRAWVWRRPRGESTIDWRRSDPSGSGFRLVNDSTTAVDQSVKLARALGLSMSAQDWLEGDDDPVFLECNPQGAWLFLDSACDVIVPAITRHLTGGGRS